MTRRSGARIERALYTDPRLIEVSGFALAVYLAAKIWAVADPSQRVAGEEDACAGWLLTETGEPCTEARLGRITRFSEKAVFEALEELLRTGTMVRSDAGVLGVRGWRETSSTPRVQRWRDRKAAA